MVVEVNYAAVVLAAISSMAIGSIWYAPMVFGGTWMQLIGRTPKELSKDWHPVVYFYVFVASLITAYVIAYVAYLANSFFHNNFIQDAVSSGFWLWLGLTAVRLYTHDVFERRRKKLTLLNISHEFVAIMTMAIIIGLLKP